MHEVCLTNSTLFAAIVFCCVFAEFFIEKEKRLLRLKSIKELKVM